MKRSCEVVMERKTLIGTAMVKCFCRSNQLRPGSGVMVGNFGDGTEQPPLYPPQIARQTWSEHL